MRPYFEKMEEFGQELKPGQIKSTEASLKQIHEVEAQLAEASEKVNYAGLPTVKFYAGGQLTATTGVSDASAAPGQRVTLITDVVPKPSMHVYAPGQTGYLPIAVNLDPSADFRAHAMRFPAAGTYFFAPLKETVKVFDKPSRLTQEITLALTPELRKRATAKESLVITGSLNYQACDDKVCYRPETIPLVWTIQLTPFVR